MSLKLLGVGALSLVGAYAVKSIFFTKKKRGKCGSGEVLTKEQLLKIYVAFNKALDAPVSKLPEQAVQIREHYMRQGREIPDDQVIQICQQSLLQEMKKFESQLYSHYRTTEKQVKKALKLYKDDKSVQEQLAKMRDLASVVAPVGVDESIIPDDFTEDTLIEYLTAMFDDICTLMEKCSKTVVDQGVSKSDASYQARVLSIFQPQVEIVSANLPSKFGITDEVFKAAVVKYETPRVMQAITVLYADRTKRFEACGITTAAGGL